LRFLLFRIEIFRIDILGIESVLWYYGSIETNEIWQQVGTVTD